MNFEAEIQEILFQEMKDFIKSKPELDRYNFISSALTNFLYENGCEDRLILERYLNEVFEQSPSQ